MDRLTGPGLSSWHVHQLATNEQCGDMVRSPEESMMNERTGGRGWEEEREGEGQCGDERAGLRVTMTGRETLSEIDLRE